MKHILIKKIKELSIDKQIEALEDIDWSVLEGRNGVDGPAFGLCYMLSLRFRMKLHNTNLFKCPEYNELAVLIPTFKRTKAIEFLMANYPNDSYLECLNRYWFQRSAYGDKQRKEFIEYLIKDLKAKQNGR